MAFAQNTQKLLAPKAFAQATKSTAEKSQDFLANPQAATTKETAKFVSSNELVKVKDAWADKDGVFSDGDGVGVTLDESNLKAVLISMLRKQNDMQQKINMLCAINMQQAQCITTLSAKIKSGADDSHPFSE